MTVFEFLLASFWMLLSSALGAHGANASSLGTSKMIMALPPNAQRGFNNSSAAPITEQPQGYSLQWQGRTPLRRGNSFLQTTIVAIASTLAVAAMVFLVLHCFKALGKSYSEVHRRLVDNPAFEGDDGSGGCTTERHPDLLSSVRSDELSPPYDFHVVP
ncbi:hypothetical protein Efla_002723 [Eimeria flavescens]